MDFKQAAQNALFQAFLAKNPKACELRREAKRLRKELSANNPHAPGLMQCQDLAAQNHGFADWRHFLAILKSAYREDFDRAPFHSETEAKFDPERILLGHDLNFNLYKYAGADAMRTHFFTAGSRLHSAYPCFLASQAIAQGLQTRFFNPDPASASELAEIASRHRLPASVIRFGAGAGPAGGQPPNCRLRPTFAGWSSGGAAELVLGILQDSAPCPAAMGRMISVLSSHLMMLFHLCGQQGKDPGFELCAMSLMDPAPFTDMQIQAAPAHIQAALAACAAAAPEADEPSNLALRAQAGLILYDISQNSAFDPAAPVCLSEHFASAEPFVALYLFDPQHPLSPLMAKFMALCAKLSMAQRLGACLNAPAGIPESPKPKQNSYFFFRDIPLPKGMAVFPAQARSLRLALHFAYPSFKDFFEKAGRPEAESILANCLSQAIDPDELPAFANALQNRPELLECMGLANPKGPARETERAFSKASFARQYFWLARQGRLVQAEFASLRVA